MIINTGQRTDIPAFFSDWFYNRISQGFVYVRNPYFNEQITKYVLNPNVVDCLSFCTKNPEPMLGRLHEIKEYNQFWFVTITGYDSDIEPNVPSIDSVIKSFISLSNIVGSNCVQWRYDPIFLSEKYSIKKHLETFENIASKLHKYTDTCIISFIDFYNSTRRFLPQIIEVPIQEQIFICNEMVKIASRYNIRVKTCMENDILVETGVDITGCINKEVLEKALNIELNIPKLPKLRESCNCLLGNDIGEYNTCMHKCLYCYANSNFKEIDNNFYNHNPLSPILIGEVSDKEKIKNAKQVKYATGQFFLF
ncbi:MAG: DUF1848 domain-containing protein [Spirochaetales bacterium]|nr:DUF1848 domain-containing protein [Spirochaetales bacterium]